MSDPLDTRLSAPLEDIPDGGFSDRVMLRLLAARRRAAAWEAGLAAAATAVICGTLPFTEFGQAINEVALQLARDVSLPMAATAVVVALSAIAVQTFAD